MERTYVFTESGFRGGLIDFWSLPSLPAGRLFGRIQSGGPTQKLIRLTSGIRYRIYQAA